MSLNEELHIFLSNLNLSIFTCINIYMYQYLYACFGLSNPNTSPQVRITKQQIVTC